MAETHGKPEPNRRDVLYLTTGAAGVVGGAAAVWPLIDQMNPDASVKALSSITVDASTMEAGQQITVTWQGKPVFIRRRTVEEIAAARAVDLSDLPDNSAENANLPDGASAADENRALDDSGEWLVMVGICTHLGCVPLGEAGDFNGWFCPCHGSHYDTAGRIRKGPAPLNLLIPVAELSGDGIIKIG